MAFLSENKDRSTGDEEKEKNRDKKKHEDDVSLVYRVAKTNKSF